MAIGISPAKLEFALKKGETLSQKIFIQNLENNPTKVAMNLSDSKYDNRVIITPQELILPKGQTQEVNVQIIDAKNIRTEIEIISLAAAQGQLQIVTGVKIPLEVKMEGGWNWVMLALPFILALLATGAAFYLNYKKLKMA